VSTVVTAMFSCPLGDDAALLPRTAAISDAYHELLAANHQRLAWVTVHTEAANQRSRVLAARLGFIEEGLHRQAVVIGDQRRDEVVYGLLADEWRAHRTTSRETDDRGSCKASFTCSRNACRSDRRSRPGSQ